MSTTAAAAALARLGFAEGQVIQEFGYDDDVDESLRVAIEELTGHPLEDEDFGEGADAVLVWYRDGDDDLVDLLVDAVSNLFDQGHIVLATPKPGQRDHVDAAEVEDAATTAGLNVSGTVNVGADWLATRLMSPKGPRR